MATMATMATTIRSIINHTVLVPSPNPRLVKFTINNHTLSLTKFSSRASSISLIPRRTLSVKCNANERDAGGSKEALTGNVDVPEVCQYTITVKTGHTVFAGTDSVISLYLYNDEGVGIRVKDLEKWGGQMGPKHNYFQMGNLDRFSGQAKYVPGPLCKLKLITDGSGKFPGWYCSYVEVETGEFKKRFEVFQWLKDSTDYMVVKDDCGNV